MEKAQNKLFTGKKLSSEELSYLKSIVNDSRFVAFDFETTGLSAKKERIVEIGAVSFRIQSEDGHFSAIDISEYSKLIKPDLPIPSSVQKIHGITNKMVEKCPSFCETYQSFLDFIDEAVLLAHNVGFDTSFLQEECKRNKIAVPEFCAFDTITVARTAYPGLKSYALENLTSSLGLTQERAHRACSDAYDCVNLFSLCLNKLFE